MSLFNFDREDNNKLQTKRQKEPEATYKGASGYVKPEWANKWHNSMIARLLLLLLLLLLHFD
jgi:hypothetical protein